MSPEVEAKIEAALLAHVEALDWPAQNIAWPNPDKPFEPRRDSLGKPLAYIRPTVLPAETQSPGAGRADRDEHRGVLQISLFYPAGTGASAPMMAAGQILRHFRKDTALRRDGVMVRVRKAPWREPAMQEPDWYHVPLRVPYIAITDPA